MQPIAILCPSDTELDPFLPLLTELREHEQAMLRIYQGRLDGLPVVALYSGVCKVNTALAVQLLLDRFGAGAIINCGTCGGMAPEARLFETVITTESAYHDVAGDILTDFHPWMPTVWFPSDPGLLAAARRVADRRRHLLLGRTVSGEQFITQENRDRIRLRAALGGYGERRGRACLLCQPRPISCRADRDRHGRRGRRGGI